MSANQFDQSRNTCHDDVIQALQGLLIVIRWSKTHQTVASSPVLPIPAIQGHSVDPVAAFHHLLSTSPSSLLDHPLLSYQHGDHQVVVTVPMLASAFSSMIGALDLDPVLYSLHTVYVGAGPRRLIGRGYTKR